MLKMTSSSVFRDIQRNVTTSRSRGFLIDDILFNNNQKAPAYSRDSPSPKSTNDNRVVTSLGMPLSPNAMPAEYAALAAMYAHAHRQHTIDLSAAQHQALTVTSHPLFATKPIHEHPLLLPAVHGKHVFYGCYIMKGP